MSFIDIDGRTYSWVAAGTGGIIGGVIGAGGGAIAGFLEEGWQWVFTPCHEFNWQTVGVGAAGGAATGAILGWTAGAAAGTAAGDVSGTVAIGIGVTAAKSGWVKTTIAGSVGGAVTGMATHPEVPCNGTSRWDQFTEAADEHLRDDVLDRPIDEWDDWYMGRTPTMPRIGIRP